MGLSLAWDGHRSGKGRRIGSGFIAAQQNLVLNVGIGHSLLIGLNDYVRFDQQRTWAEL